MKESPAITRSVVTGGSVLLCALLCFSVVGQNTAHYRFTTNSPYVERMAAMKLAVRDYDESKPWADEAIAAINLIQQSATFEETIRLHLEVGLADPNPNIRLQSLGVLAYHLSQSNILTRPQVGEISDVIWDRLQLLPGRKEEVDGTYFKRLASEFLLAASDPRAVEAFLARESYSGMLRKADGWKESDGTDTFQSLAAKYSQDWVRSMLYSLMAERRKQGRLLDERQVVNLRLEPGNRYIFYSSTNLQSWVALDGIHVADSNGVVAVRFFFSPRQNTVFLKAKNTSEPNGP